MTSVTSQLVLCKTATAADRENWIWRVCLTKTQRLHFHSRLPSKITCVWRHAWPSRIPSNRRQALIWQLHIIIHKNLAVLRCSIISIKLIDTCMSNVIRKWHFLWGRSLMCLSYKGFFFPSQLKEAMIRALFKKTSLGKRDVDKLLTCVESPVFWARWLRRWQQAFLNKTSAPDPFQSSFKPGLGAS